MAGGYLDSFVRIQKETTWGTAVATGMFTIPTLTWDVNPAYDLYQSQMVTGAAGAPAPAFGVKRVAGRWTTEAGYNALDHMLYGVLGAGSNVSGATDPFLNRYTPATSLPSFTVHASYGNLPTGKVVEFQGVKINTLELTFDAAQGYMNAAADVIAEEAEHTTTTGVTAGTVAATGAITHDPIIVTPSAYVSVLDIGIGSSLAYCVRSGSIKIERNLSANRICIGSDLIKEPVCTQPMKVSGTFNVEWLDLTILNALTQKTVHTTTNLKWDGGTHSIDIIMPKVVYTSISTPIQQGDALISAVSWIAYGTAGSGATSEPINVSVESAIDFDVL